MVKISKGIGLVQLNLSWKKRKQINICGLRVALLKFQRVSNNVLNITHGLLVMKRRVQKVVALAKKEGCRERQPSWLCLRC